MNHPTPTKPATLFDISHARNAHRRVIDLREIGQPSQQANIAQIGTRIIPVLFGIVIGAFIFSIF